jgi:hypothetical protein
LIDPDRAVAVDDLLGEGEIPCDDKVNANRG